MNKIQKGKDKAYDSLLQTPNPKFEEWDRFAEEHGFQVAYNNMKQDFILMDELVNKAINSIEGGYFQDNLKPYEVE